MDSMDHKKAFTLKKALTLSFLLIALLPVIITGTISLTVMSGMMERDILEKNYEIAKAVAGEISRTLDEPMNIMGAMEAMLIHQRLIQPHELNRYLGTLIQTYPLFDSLKILDNRGVVTQIAPYSKDFVNIDLSSHPFFRETSITGRPMWSSPYISPRTGTPTLTLTYPLSKGMAVANINLSYLKNITDRIKIGTNGYAAMVDRSGTILAHPDSAHIAEQRNIRHLPAVARGIEGEKGTLRYTFDGIKWMGSVEPVPITGWLVCIFQPVREAMAPVTHIRNIIFFGIVSALFLAILGSLIIVKRTMTPLAELLSGTMQIARGDYTHTIELRSYGEINTLAHYFNIMNRAILSREDALKKDMEKRKRLEEQLRQAHKMEAIGTLAGGIAHDFNNILAVIIGYAEMARHGLNKHGNSKEVNQLDQILKASYRARDLVKQILTFSRKESKERIHMNLANAVNETLQLIRATIPATVKICNTVEVIDANIMADPTEIHQVVMNLCTNAAHAMETGGGTLTVSLFRVTDIGEDKDAAFSIKNWGKNRGFKSREKTPEKIIPQSRPYLKLSIQDTGTGIDSKYMERIFDPYFTTKGVGKGSGMGLSVVMGIVKNHEGFIGVESSPGKGTMFHVFFPEALP
ncbi:MAG: HAMP domain-containing protein [Desulfamplus sp.]|nr:HAMP domain-containing protein [Desulfamplus sp.]